MLGVDSPSELNPTIFSDSRHGGSLGTGFIYNSLWNSKASEITLWDYPTILAINLVSASLVKLEFVIFALLPIFQTHNFGARSIKMYFIGL